jgi:tyrosine-protein kinase Etk/Wzc
VNENYNSNDIYQEESIDFKALFFKFYRHWLFFVVTVFVALAVAFLFNKYTNSVYEVTTTVLVENKSSSDAQSLLGLGFGNNLQNLQNEIGKLKSYKLSYQTITNLDFEVSYYGEDNFLTKELYNESPFFVEFDKEHTQTLSLNFFVNIESNAKFKLSAEGENLQLFDYSSNKKLKDIILPQINLSDSYRFGEWIQSESFKFRIMLNNNFDYKKDLNKNFYFVFNSINSLVGRYRNFEIEPINKESSVILIKLKGNNINKMVDFLNKLTEVYLNMELEKKNQIANKTIEFIDTQLITITDNLDSAELNLQNFRTENDLMNIDFQSTQAFEQMEILTQKKAELLLSDKYYQSLRDYIQNKDDIDDIIVPSALGINDPFTNGIINALIVLYEERAELLYGTTEKNPAVKQLDKKIKKRKESLLENIDNLLKASQISIKDIDERINTLSAEINKLPLTQRRLFTMERQFELSNTMYVYLLKKRSEAQITSASNQPDNEIIDQARAEAVGSPVYPRKSLNYLIALILGLLLPVAYILGKEYFNDKIIERKDVENITKLPILGHTLHSDRESKIAVAAAPKSSIAESFRSIRTNLKYLSKGKDKQVILITSDIVGAGKTYTSINLSSVYAMYNKKTLLIGFDLRKPRIFQDFELHNTKGLASYLINKHELDEIIQKSSIKNLDIIMSGPVPPNPAELMGSPKTKELMAQLKEKYDYIIIDTPPVGLVTDAFLLMEYADTTLFIVRQNFTHKKVFASIIKDIEQRGIPQH